MKKFGPSLCMLSGVSLMLYSSLALAQTKAGEVSFEYLFTTLVAITILVVSAYFKGVKDSLQRDIAENKDEINGLDTYINANHVTKKELSYVLREEMIPLQKDITAIKNLLKIRS
tara:strand:+ start:627 stop:971 length:345 start_codon:yes stop_codon:yes gene_type:complete